MKKTFFFTYLLALCGTLQSAEGPIQMEISQGGYTFYTTYKLTLPRSHKKSKSVKVKLITGSGTSFEKRLGGRALGGDFTAKLRFRGTEIVKDYSYGNDKPAKKNILSSRWYPGIKQIFDRAANREFQKIIPWLQKNWTKQELGRITKRDKHRKVAKVKVKALQNHKLENIYTIRVRSKGYHVDSPISPGVHVRIKSAFEKFGNKKMLVFTAAFKTNKHPTIEDPVSIIKFAQTENGLEEIERVGIEPSSLWYPWIKEVAKRNARFYANLKALHEV